MGELNQTQPGRALGVEAIAAACQRILENIAQVMVMDPEVGRLLLTAALCGGHVLIEDVPGVGKTTLARAAAISLGCRFGRIQCTPDLLPSDVVGVSVFNEKTGEFEYRQGPIMAQVVLADEINRATPRTQSSLLEAMAEGQVTVDGVTYALPRPFILLATENPIEYEGTFPLPEAQLDRFFMRISLGYPTPEQEHEIVKRMQGEHPLARLEPCTTPEEFVAMQEGVRQVHVDDSVRDYAIRIVQATRSDPDVLLGASPRGSINLVRAAQARAALFARDFVTPDDVKALAVPVLGHRLVLKAESRLRGLSGDRVVERIVERTPVRFEDAPAV